MFGFSTWKKGWSLLDRRERKQAAMVLCVVILAALSSAGMVSSVMPFLSVLSDPDRITQVPQFAWLYKHFGFTSSYSFLVMLGVGSLTVILVSSAIQILKTYSVVRFTMMRVHSISYRLLAQYLRQPYEFFLDRHSGDMATNILAEAGQVVSQFFRPAAELIASSLAVIAVVSVLVWIDPVVAVLSFLVMGGTYAGTYVFCRAFISRIGKARAQANSERFLIANEALGGIKDIKLLGREAAYVDRYTGPSAQMARSEVGVNVVSQLPRFVVEGIAFSGIILLCLVLLDPSGFQNGQALGSTLPMLGVFALAGQRVLPELQKIYLSATQLSYGAAAVDRVYVDLFLAAGAGDLPREMPTGIDIKRGFRLDAVGFRMSRWRF
jgi:ABC-type multidrug transport system fused ATPase/permease subunit